MPQTKQIPIISKPDAYAYVASGYGALGLATATVPANLNGYFEINPQGLDNSHKVSFNKRPGVSDNTFLTTFSNLICTNAAERIKGLTTSLDKTKLVFVSQDATKRYSNFYDASTNTLTQTDISASFVAGEYAFTQLDNINFGSGVAYATTNGTEGALISATGVWSKISDADYTSTGVKTCFVGLDGYLFYGVISGTGAGRIYSSELSVAAAATGWNATSYISAYDVPGAIVWLARIRNYIVCFKQGSIEFFENVGAPTPGSPLEARKGLTKSIGCASASSVQYVDDGIIFLGIDKNGKQSVYKLESANLELKKISNAVVDMSLHNSTVSIANFQSFSNDYEGASNTAKGQSQIIVWHNKQLYTICINSYWGSAQNTMVYDNELDIWYIWATNFGGAGDGAVQDRHFVPSMCFQLTAGGTGGYYTMFANNYASISKSRFSMFTATSSSTNISANYNWMDAYSATTSEFQNFPMAWRSEHFDFGTHDRKLMHSIEVIYDIPSFGGASTINGVMSLSLFRIPNKSRNYITPARTIYSPNTAESRDGYGRFKVNRLGQFRSAAISLYTYGATPMRIWATEVNYSGGPQYA